MDFNDSPVLEQIPETITTDCAGLNWEQVSSLSPHPPQDANLAADGWLWFNNVAVNHEEGSLLLGFDNQPLRGQQLLVVALDVHWRYGFSFSTAIRSPLGKNMPTPEGWRFPGLARYGMVIYQVTGPDSLRAWQIHSDRVDSPQEICLNPQERIFVNINDQRGSYSDNSGSFDLLVKVMA
ncbi:MAG: hypothetical protein Q6L58_02245 [Thermostichales cyanobacterium BF3_bins_165]